MNCHATRAVLDLHAEGRLSERRTKSVVTHLASCAACRALSEPIAVAPTTSAAGGFKARLAEALKTDRKVHESRPVPALDLTLWPRDFSGADAPRNRC